MLFDIEFFIALVLFVFSFVLLIAPPKKAGIINFIMGMTTVAVSASIAMGFTGATELVEQYFMVCVSLIGVFCALRGDGVLR